MLEINAITKTYGGDPALSEVSFTVERGRVTGFVGPNGAGKTTAMRIMVGLVHPDEGSATFDGRVYADLEAPMKVVGTLLDGPAANPRERVRAHLLGLAIAIDVTSERVDEVLAQVGLDTAARKRVGQLSLGMGQRLALAEALLADPDYLILDEPFIGLDVDGIRWLRSLIVSLAAAGKAVLLSNHHMTEMELLADDLVMIGAGKIVSQGSADSLMLDALPARLTIRTPDGTALAKQLRSHGFLATMCDGRLAVSADGRMPELRRLLESIGVSGIDIDEVPPTLEDIFVDTMHGHSQYTTSGV